MINRLLYLLAALSFTSANCPYHNRHHGKYEHIRAHHNKLFEEISNDVIALDKKLHALCTQNSNQATKEIIEVESYKLTTPLDGFTENDVEVKIRNKVLYIDANKPPQKRYSEIRLLPSFVDTKQASFHLVDGILTVEIHFKSAAGDECANDVESDVISVTKSEPVFYLGTERMAEYKR